MNHGEGRDRFATQRLETLIDGIFAIAMTLLVFNIKLPERAEIAGGAELAAALAALVPHFSAFVQSFLLLGLFWFVSHRQMRAIRHADARFVWITLLWLMAVVLVPFSTSLNGEFGRYWEGAAFFHGNLLIIGLLSFSIWQYADRKALIHESLSAAAIRAGKRRGLLFPLVALLALAVAPWSPGWSNLFYLLIPAALPLLGRNDGAR
jgi:uncharacterized membrane protein